VELVNPYSGLTLTTKKHFSYYKFFLPENVDSFQLTLANCTVQIHLKVRIYWEATVLGGDGWLSREMGG
jgi:hypothetical protein